MLIESMNGYEFHLPTSGGKAGKGKQKTSTIQVRKDNIVVKQFRFVVDSVKSMKTAVAKAKEFAIANKPNIGDRVLIPAAQIEFVDGGNTIWVHGPDGATVLRIKATGKVVAVRGCTNVCSHSDMVVLGDIEVCVVQRDLPGD